MTPAAYPPTMRRMLAQSPAVISGADPSQALALGLLLFALLGIAMVAVALAVGRLVRPRLPMPVKGEAYECGEPAIGDGWVQFDLRFYVVALVFIIFEIEVALFYPWAVVFRQAGVAGFVDILVFFGLIAIGFLFLWRFGYLDWVRSSPGHQTTTGSATNAPAFRPGEMPGTDIRGEPARF